MYVTKCKSSVSHEYISSLIPLDGISKHHSSIFHISALPSANPRFSSGGGDGGSAVGPGDDGAVPEDFEVALEEAEPVESRTEDELTRVLVPDAAVFIVLERVEVAPVDRLELLTVLAVEVALVEEEPVERRMDDDTPVDRLTLLAVLAVEVGFDEEEPVEKRTDDAEDEGPRVFVADTAVFIVLVRFEEVPPVERLKLLAVLAVENGLEEERPVERRTDDIEDAVTRLLVADTVVFIELERFEVIPVDKLTFLAVLIVEAGFVVTLVVRIMIAKEDVVAVPVLNVLERCEVTLVDRLKLLVAPAVEVGFEEALVVTTTVAEEALVESPVLNVADDLLVDLVPELALIDSLDEVPVLRVIDGLDETTELRMIVAEDDLVDSPVLNVMDDVIVDEDAVFELALIDGLDETPVLELALMIPVLELALIDGLDETPVLELALMIPVLELALIDGLDETPVLELALPDSLDDTPVFRDIDGVDENPVRKLLGVVRTRVLKLAEGFEEVPELKTGFDEDPVLRDTVGLLETPVLSLTGVAETLMTENLEEKPVVSDTEDLEEKPVLNDAEGLEERPVLSDADGLEEPVLSDADGLEEPVLSDADGLEERPVLNDADGLEEKLVVSGSEEGFELGVVKRVETTLTLEEREAMVIVGVVSMHEQMVLMNCGSCVKQDAHIDELAALSVGEGAVMVFLSFLPDLSRSSLSLAVTVTAGMGKFREQYASAGG